jgi:hypothetical protein
MSRYDDIEFLRAQTDDGDSDRHDALDEVEYLRDLGFPDDEIEEELGGAAALVEELWDEPPGAWSESDGEGATTEGEW